MKRYRFTLAALLVFAALLAWVMTQERGRMPEKGEVFRLSAPQISKLEVTHDGDKLVLERRDQRWQLTEPVSGLADPSVVEGMLDALLRLKPSKREDADITDAEYGLQTPVLVVTYHTRSGEATTVKLGAETPVGAEYFATISGHPELYLISSSFKSAMSKKLDDLRDKQLVRLDKDDVRMFKMERADETLIVERRTVGNGDQWHLRQPLDTPADRFAVEDLIDTVIRAKAAEFIDMPEDLSTVGLDDPQVTFTLTTKANEEVVVRVGEEIEKEVPREYGEGTETRRVVYVQTEEHPQLLLVYANLVEDTNKDSFALRDKTILHFAKNDVITVKVQAKTAASFEASKNDAGDWILKAPAGAQANVSKLDSLLWGLDDLQATAFEEGDPQDLQKYGLALPEAVITLTIRGQSQPVKVTFGKPADPGARYCKTSQSQQVYQVSDTILENLPASLEELTEPNDDYE